MEQALDNLFLQDIERSPQVVAVVLLTDRLEKFLDFLIGYLHLIHLLARADCDCVDCEILPLLLGEFNFTHPVHYSHLLLHLLNGGGDCTAEFLEAVVDVADRNALEFLRGDYETVGAYEAEDTYHELEGVESVMGVGEDNLRICVNLLALLGLLRDIHLGVLKRYEVERADI